WERTPPSSSRTPRWRRRARRGGASRSGGGACSFLAIGLDDQELADVPLAAGVVLDREQVEAAGGGLPLARDQVPSEGAARERGRIDVELAARVVDAARAPGMIAPAVELALEHQVAREREDLERAALGQVREPQVVVAHQLSLVPACLDPVGIREHHRFLARPLARGGAGDDERLVLRDAALERLDLAAAEVVGGDRGEVPEAVLERPHAELVLVADAVEGGVPGQADGAEAGVETGGVVGRRGEVELGDALE